jgi:hypothetical protein
MKKALTGVIVVLALSGWGFGKGTRVSLRISGGTAMARYSDLPDSGSSSWFAQDMKDRFGPAAGVGIDLALGSSGRLAWISTVEYVQLGAKPDFYYFDPYYDPPYMMIPVTFTMDLIAFTQLLKLRPFAKGAPYVLGGVDLSYVIDHRSDLMSQIGSLTKKVNFGLVGGVGAELIKGDWAPFLEARYHLGLADLSKGVYSGVGGFPSLKTRAFVFLAGIRLKWGRGGA